MISAPQACPSKAWTKCHSVSVPICLWVGGWKYRQGGVPQIQNAKEKAPKETHTDSHAYSCLTDTHMFTQMHMHT